MWCLRSGSLETKIRVQSIREGGASVVGGKSGQRGGRAGR